MANANTKRVRKNRDGFGVKKGKAINSSTARAASGKKPAALPARS